MCEIVTEISLAYRRWCTAVTSGATTTMPHDAMCCSVDM